MILWFAALAVLVAVVLGAHWAWSKQPHWWSIGLCLVVASLAGFFGWRALQFEAELAAAVATITDVADAKVDCGGIMSEFVLDRYLGTVAFDGEGGTSNVAKLDRSVCGHIRDWQNSGFASTNADQVIAVHVLTHEAMHVAGHMSEAMTECLAMQADAEMAEVLGATPTQARQLAERYWNDFFPRMPGIYRAADCYDEGPLDQRPNDPIWP